jgi:ribosomal protein S18 acetylase RimI-like enzyme
MTVTLEPPDDADFTSWLAASFADYVRERIAAGESPELAAGVATEQHDVLFPGGRPAPDQHVFRVHADGIPVGWLWLGDRMRGEEGSWWVYKIQIDSDQRGRGYGRAAMLEVRRRGGHTLGLNVFGPNTVARRLYESLGYQTAATNMVKRLAGGLGQ